MGGGIFLVRGDGGLVAMSEQGYPSEDLLQELLAKYPDLLAGGQIDGIEPRRWVLVSREMPLASEEDGSGRWSVDYLFLDQDAVPTIVEVKRSTDTRIRREVVGQMLDYAANAVVYWPVAALRERFEGSEDHERLLAELPCAPDADPKEFWGKVKTNLQAGKVRLIFVADEILAELRRVVEFLNGQMDPAEVLAVEIKQYVGQGMKTLVPRVVGQTAEAQQKKTGGQNAGRQWDETSFFVELEARKGAIEAKAARKILDWAKKRMPHIYWGKGKVYGSFIPGLSHRGKWHQVVGVGTNGTVEIQFQYMRSKPPFDEEPRRLELLRRLNETPGVDIAQGTIDRRPTIPTSLLGDPAALETILGALDWFVRKIEAT